MKARHRSNLSLSWPELSFLVPSEFPRRRVWMFPRPTCTFLGSSTVFGTHKGWLLSELPSHSFLCLIKLRRVLWKPTRDQLECPACSLTRSRVSDWTGTKRREALSSGSNLEVILCRIQWSKGFWPCRSYVDDLPESSKRLSRIWSTPSGSCA